MEKINLLLVTLRADLGGGPKHVDFIVNNLSPHLYNLYLACPEDKPFYRNWQVHNHVQEIVTLPHRQFKVKELLKLVKFCKEKQIHIIHSHGKGAGVYTRFLKIFLPQVKVVHTFHGIHIAEYSEFKKKLYFLYEKVAAKFTDRFLNVSNGEKAICLEHNFLPVNRSSVIYNAIDMLPRAKECPDFKPENKFVVTTISRFDFSKNMSLTYEIAKSLRDVKNMLFLWVGDGEDKLKLEEKARQEKLENILFVGFKENVADHLSFSHVYLSTSRWEGLPYALIEASSLAIPMVATDVVGNNEVVIHEVNGFLYPGDQPEVAASYLTKLMEDETLHQRLGTQALEIFHEKFHIEKMIQDLEKVYHTVTERGR